MRLSCQHAAWPVGSLWQAFAHLTRRTEYSRVLGASTVLHLRISSARSTMSSSEPPSVFMISLLTHIMVFERFKHKDRRLRAHWPITASCSHFCHFCHTA